MQLLFIKVRLCPVPGFIYSTEENIEKKLFTSTDVDPLYPKSCSLNGNPSMLSAVSWRYFAIISFWYLEFVATVIGYQTCTNNVYNKMEKMMLK